MEVSDYFSREQRGFLHHWYGGMTAVLKLPIEHDRPQPQLEPAALALLNRIRFLAASCRASAKLDLFEACALLDTEADNAEEAHIVTLIRVMGQALDTRPVFRRPGEADLSFDESWLLAAITARLRDDEHSFAFLVSRRIEPSKRRTFGMLIFGLVDQLRSVEDGDSPKIPGSAPSQTRLSL